MIIVINGAVQPAKSSFFAEPTTHRRGQSVIQSIEEAIRSGRLPEGQRVPPVRELAREHGVSYGAALRAVEMLERKGLIERFHGSGTYVKRNAPDADTSTVAPPWVGLMVDKRAYLLGDLYQQLLWHLSQAQMALFAIGDNHALPTAREITRTWREHPPRAIILTVVNAQIEQAVERCSPQRTRVISLVFPKIARPGWHSVSADLSAVGRMAAEHFIGQGHRQIGLLTKGRSMRPDWPQTHRKAWMPETDLILSAGQAVRNAGIERGLMIHYNNAVDENPSAVPIDEENVAAMTAWLSQPGAPTAVVTNDFRVPGLRRAAERAGRRIGQDLHLVSFGPGGLAQFADHPCIDLRYDLVAREAAAIASCDDREMGDCARHILVPPQWVPGTIPT